MRVLRISVALWYDPFWRSAFRRSWKTRRYWLAIVPTPAASGRAFALQTMMLTFKIHLEGKDHG